MDLEKIPSDQLIKISEKIQSILEIRKDEEDELEYNKKLKEVDKIFEETGIGIFELKRETADVDQWVRGNTSSRYEEREKAGFEGTAHIKFKGKEFNVELKASIETYDDDGFDFFGVRGEVYIKVGTETKEHSFQHDFSGEEIIKRISEHLVNLGVDSKYIQKVFEHDCFNLEKYCTEKFN